MPNPLDGLKKAQHIGPDPLGASNMSRGEMMPFPVGSAMEAIAGIPKVAEAAKGASELFPGMREYFGPVQETLGEYMPDFTPVGGESMYNIGKQALKGVSDPLEWAYKRIQSTMGK